MGFNLSQIINNELFSSEQKSYNLVFVPPKPGRYTSSGGFVLNRWAKQMEGITHLYSDTAGGQIKFAFSGTRIGVLLQRNIGNGKISIDIDGMAYGVVDTGDTDVSAYNVPHIIATDLPQGSHTLTITKIDSSVISIQGFLVDDANSAQSFARSAIDYHQTLDDGKGQPLNISTTGVVVSNIDMWMINAIITNTTGSTINVTLKDGNDRSIIGAFPVPANDFRAIPGPIMFYGGIKAVASATGCYIVVGGQ